MTAPVGAPEPVTLDRRFLLLALVPVAVYMLVAYVILDVIRRDDVTFAIIAADTFPTVAAAEARYRSFWATAFLLSAAVSLAVAVSIVLDIWRLRLARDRWLILGLIVVGIIATAAIETIDSLRGATRWYDSLGLIGPAASQSDAALQANAIEPRGLFRTVFQAPPEGVAGEATLPLLDTGLDMVKTLGAIALTLVAAGLILTLAEPQRRQTPAERAARLGRDLQRQKELLQQGAAVYVLAIVSMLAWMHWPLPFLASDAVRGDYRDLLVANALLQGTAYSLGIAAIYLPAAMLLRRRIADLAETTPDAAPTWLREQGLEAQPFDQLRQMATVLLPAIVGILPALEKLWN